MGDHGRGVYPRLPDVSPTPKRVRGPGFASAGELAGADRGLGPLGPTPAIQHRLGLGVPGQNAELIASQAPALLFKEPESELPV